LFSTGGSTQEAPIGVSTVPTSTENITETGGSTNRNNGQVKTWYIVEATKYLASLSSKWMMLSGFQAMEGRKT